MNRTDGRHGRDRTYGTNFVVIVVWFVALLLWARHEVKPVKPAFRVHQPLRQMGHITYEL